MTLKDKFLNIYANLPLALRKETIIVSDKETLTWNVVYVEVFNNTKKSEKILKRLEELRII